MSLRRGVPLLLLAIAALAARPATAAAGTWSLRLRGMASNYEHEYRYSYAATSHLRVEDGRGFELAGEYRWGLLGVELAAGRLTFDARAWETQLVPVSFDPLVFEERTIYEDEGRFVLEPLTLSLLVHPRRGAALDPYFGPLVGVVRYQVEVYSQDHEPDLAYGGRVGLEYSPAGSHWGFGGDYRYVFLSHETVDRDLYGSGSLGIASLHVTFRAPVARDWATRD